MKTLASLFLFTLISVPAFAYEREFQPDEGFAQGCETGGLVGAFRFARNGRVGTLKFPATNAAFVLFQTDENDLYRWRVSNDDDEMAVNFRYGTLSYAFDDGTNSYSCQGRFTP